MKFATVLVLATVFGSAAALAPATKKTVASVKKAVAPIKKAITPTKTISPVKKISPVSKAFTAIRTKTGAYTLDTIPGALAPTGPWDPFNLATKADANLLKRYREAELAHGRVAMLAVVGFLVGEAVEGTSFLFDASISGPAITHLPQVPVPFWVVLGFFIGYLELGRAEIGWVPPEETPLGRPGLLRPEYNPGELGFDPLGLKPSDPKEYLILQNKELQNGRLAMLAAAGFLAQEATDGQGILQHLFSS
jgi:hypothetical protein